MKEYSKVNKKRPTIVDVARLANVSTATAARVFDKKWSDRVKASNKDAVLEAARELNYLGPNALVSGLSQGRSNIIAIIISNRLGYFYKEVMLNLISKIRETGRQVLVFDINPEKESIEKVVTEIYQFNVGGIVITSSATSDIVSGLQTIDIPIIIFNRTAIDSNVSCVYCDDIHVGKMAADYLIDNGHKKLAVITGEKYFSHRAERINSFIEHSQKRGASIVAVEHGDYSYESGYSAARRILQQGIPEAIYCGDDTMAVAAIDLARKEYKLKIPFDISIMGTDDINIGNFTAYNLTTMQHPLERMIDGTINVLEKVIADPSMQCERVYEMQIIERASVMNRNIKQKYSYRENQKEYAR